MKRLNTILPAVLGLLLESCMSTTPHPNAEPVKPDSSSGLVRVVKPFIVTEPVKYDSDDPAIWINPKDTAASLIIGTDKDADGALYVFNLEGKVVKVVSGLKRPNNVDIEYGLSLNGKPTDIAVTTERITHKLRIYSLPGMKPIDNGGIAMYEGETAPEHRDIMGIGLYKAKSGEIYAIVSRKTGPAEGYLWEYQLKDKGNGTVKGILVRKFGKFSGKKEIESIAVDDKLGYVYYSDEGFGIRKYYADPSKGNEELRVFGQHNFKVDNEGISIYESTDSTGYILVSDQQNNSFNIYTREGANGNPNNHVFIKAVSLSTLESDGSDVISLPLNGSFKKGLFVAMSTDKTFQYYKWEDIIGKESK
jgi:3-phytase